MTSENSSTLSLDDDNANEDREFLKPIMFFHELTDQNEGQEELFTDEKQEELFTSEEQEELFTSEEQEELFTNDEREELLTNDDYLDLVDQSIRKGKYNFTISFYELTII